MQIRALREDERDAMVHLVTEAFGESREGPIAAMLDSLDRTKATRADLVAVDSQRLVGHVRLSIGWIDARQQLVSALILSPLAVASDQRNRGIGKHLVAAALDEAERRGAPAVFLEGNPDYYGNCGFTKASAHGFVRPSVRIPDRSCQVAFGSGFEDWMVGGIVYPQAFWETDAVGLRDPDLARMEEQAAH